MQRRSCIKSKQASTIHTSRSSQEPTKPTSHHQHHRHDHHYSASFTSLLHSTLLSTTPAGPIYKLFYYNYASFMYLDMHYGHIPIAMHCGLFAWDECSENYWSNILTLLHFSFLYTHFLWVFFKNELPNLLPTSNPTSSCIASLYCKSNAEESSKM